MRNRKWSVAIHRFHAAIVIWSVWSATPWVLAASRPNVFLFLGDNWSSPHAGALGDRLAQTPTFDRIAREGALLRNAFCPVPSCSPTRASILTGRAAHQLGEAASLWSSFPKGLVTFTDLLDDSGYQIGYAGKPWSPGNYRDFGRSQNPVGPEFKSFDAFLDARDRDRPFFFWLGDMSTALHAWRKEFDNVTDDELRAVTVPPELPDRPEVRRDIAAYYRGIASMDQAAAAALARLERDRLLERTVVIYASDNGWQMPRGLANCYDTGTHVPLAVRWPTAIRAGRTIDEFVNLTDLAPTILEMADVPRPMNMTGRSFVDLLRGRVSAVARDRVFIERERHANVRRGNLSYPIRGVRTADFLYLHNFRPERWPAGDPEMWQAVGEYGDADETLSKRLIIEHADEPDMRKYFQAGFARRPGEELYDLRSDPAELVNVAERPEYAAVRFELSQAVTDWMRNTGDPRVDPKFDGWDKYPYRNPRVPPHAAKP